MRALSIISVVVMLLSVLAGCNTSGCLDNQNSIPLAAFYSSTTKTAITVDSLEIGGVGAPNDSLLTSGFAGISKVYLPLRSLYTSASFYIRYMRRDLAMYDLTDTITLQYSSLPYFASEECGAMYKYKIQRCETTHNLIDSVVVTDSVVTNTDIERLRIYFHTANE